MVCCLCTKAMVGRPLKRNCNYCNKKYKIHRKCIPDEGFFCQKCQNNQISGQSTFLDNNEIDYAAVDMDLMDLEDNVESETFEPSVFKILNGKSQKGKDILIYKGFSFTVKDRSKTTTFWRCCVRNGKKTCPATVSQSDTGFRIGKNDHIHDPEPGIEEKILLKAELKELSHIHGGKSGQSIAEEVLLKYTK